MGQAVPETQSQKWLRMFAAAAVESVPGTPNQSHPLEGLQNNASNNKAHTISKLWEPLNCIDLRNPSTW